MVDGTHIMLKVLGTGAVNKKMCLRLVLTLLSVCASFQISARNCLRTCAIIQESIACGLIFVFPPQENLEKYILAEAKMYKPCNNMRHEHFDQF